MFTTNDKPLPVDFGRSHPELSNQSGVKGVAVQNRSSLGASRAFETAVFYDLKQSAISPLSLLFMKIFKEAVKSLFYRRFAGRVQNLPLH
jgi:hypothetical protein